jgi:UDP-glucose 4,6-dehydratase
LTIHGKGDSKRSFIHVQDVCNAIDAVIQKGNIGEIYNIGSDDENEMSVLEIAELICRYCKNGQFFDNWEARLQFVNDRPFNDKRYFITNEKLKSIGWDCNKKLIDYISGL